MFAIPGILGILFFIYLRPQEAYEPLQGVPFLYLFFALIIFGAVVDLRLRITKAIPTPALPWAIVFVIWCLISVAIQKPDQLIPSAMSLFITVAIFVLIAQSIQTFRIFEKVVAMLIVLGLVLTWIGIDQSLAPTECVLAPKGDGNHNETGKPTGKPCVRARVCYEDSPDPAADYICERAGVLGTHSIGNRVRYRGVLQDPNELAVALSSGLALLIGLWLRTRNRLLGVLMVFSVVFVGWAVKATGSRSGQLGLLMVLAAYFFWKYRWKLVAFGTPLMIPLLLLMAKGGSDRADADASSAERYEAWRTGFNLFRMSPVWRIGFGQFNDYHFLTAHNTYILVLAELGIVGTFLFSMLIWLCIKIPLTAARQYRGVKDARVAEIWSITMLASMCAIMAGSTFLSFAYHYILWIFMGLSGGLYISIKRHDPEFYIKVTYVDAVVVFVVDAILFIVLSTFLRLKGF